MKERAKEREREEEKRRDEESQSPLDELKYINVSMLMLVALNETHAFTEKNK